MIDSNVVYDYVGDRHPYYDYAVTLLSLGIQGKVNISLSATTLSNGIYIFRRNDPNAVRQRFSLLLDRFTILPLSDEVLRAGINSSFKDVEDAFIHFSAVIHGQDITHLVTRNSKDFQHSHLKIVSPIEMIDLITA